MDSSSQSERSALGNRSFLRIGPYYLYIKPRTHSSMKLPSHEYPHSLKRAKAGTSSPEERDKRLFENFGLAQYELPFICIIYKVAGKNTFTIILHDYQGQLNKQYENDEALKAQFLNSFQPSTVPTPVSDTPISETPIHEELDNETPTIDIPSNETPARDETVIQEDGQLEGILSDDAQWKSVMLSHHLGLIQNQLELQLFEAKNQCRMITILETREMERVALVDNIRCD